MQYAALNLQGLLPRRCLKQYSNYSCPKCNTPYCTLDCYKQHSQRCTESFYRDQAVDQLRATKAGPEQQQHMAEVLKRVYAADSDEEEEASGSELDDAEVQDICALLRQGLGGVLAEDTITKIAQQAGGSARAL